MYRLGKTQTAALGAASAQITDAFESQTFAIRVASAGNCHIVIGTNPTATANDTYIPENREEYFRVNPGEKLAVIQAASATGNIYVTELSK